MQYTFITFLKLYDSFKSQYLKGFKLKNYNYPLVSLKKMGKLSNVNFFVSSLKSFLVGIYTLIWTHLYITKYFEELFVLQGIVARPPICQKLKAIRATQASFSETLPKLYRIPGGFSLPTWLLRDADSTSTLLFISQKLSL